MMKTAFALLLVGACASCRAGEVGEESPAGENIGADAALAEEMGMVPTATPDAAFDRRAPDTRAAAKADARGPIVFGSDNCSLFVATTGSDDGAGSEADPFKTLQQAARIVQAGDTVCARAGSYAGISLQGALGTGTLAKPIVFRPYKD